MAIGKTLNHENLRPLPKKRCCSASLDEVVDALECVSIEGPPKRPRRGSGSPRRNAEQQDAPTRKPACGGCARKRTSDEMDPEAIASLLDGVTLEPKRTKRASGTEKAQQATQKGKEGSSAMPSVTLDEAAVKSLLTVPGVFDWLQAMIRGPVFRAM
eukprot:Sspe_Gene.85202::Locus_56000_Transcript_1_1_Confidence_1.000_Length_514::g.85202::m.85202